MGTGDRTPLLLLHGGPGGRSCAFSVLSDLAADRRVIYYDQLGSGRSDRPNDLALWRTERFVEELDAVRKALDLREMHLLGHSWGGTLATEYLLTKGQQGVVSVIAFESADQHAALARGYAEATTHAAGAGPGSAQQVRGGGDG